MSGGARASEHAEYIGIAWSLISVGPQRRKNRVERAINYYLIHTLVIKLYKNQIQFCLINLN